MDAAVIDLGNEPPLSVDGGAGGLVDRRRLSVQWFSGTILTGLCGAALMGGAVFASLDGETNFASAPEQVENVLRGAISSIGDHLNALRKTDRLPPISEPSVARQVLRVPTSSHVRDREMVRMRPFARVTGNLTLTTTDLSAKIPPYNPQKLLTDSVGGDDQAPPAAEPDAEVSFVECDLVAPITKNKVATPGVCDLNSLLPKVKTATLLPLDDVLARVRDVASTAGSGSGMSASLMVNADGTPQPENELRAGGRSRHLFRFRAARRAGKRHAVAEDDERGERRRRLERAAGRRQERRDGRLHSARTRRAARGDQGDHRRDRPGSARRRAQGRPETARADDAGGARPYAAAARHHRRR